MRDRQSTPDTKSHHSQPTKERETQRTTAQQEDLVTQQDPLTQTISRIGIPPSAKVHANLLSRATADHPARGRQLMLQMQRQYGNRYVQRVVELSRQGAGETEATPEVEATIEQARGGGRSLDAGIQRQMESAFGTNFSGVRVHTDSTADALNQSLSARAFTTGQDIFFRQGEYNPGSSSGKELLAHELTHVVQQTGTVRGKLAIGEAGDRYEQEADKVASEVLQRLDAPAAVQRQEAIEEELQAKPEITALQRQEEPDEELQAKPSISALQRQEEAKNPNQTGLPDELKAGVENLSGYSLDDVRVHYNSSKPAQLQALAYTQGTEIHVAPGQEEHLPHEAWHVVQQMQGRVKPTMQMKGVQINDDAGLEREASTSGEDAARLGQRMVCVKKNVEHPDISGTGQRKRTKAQPTIDHVVHQLTKSLDKFRPEQPTDYLNNPNDAGLFYTNELTSASVVKTLVTQICNFWTFREKKLQEYHDKSIYILSGVHGDKKGNLYDGGLGFTVEDLNLKEIGREAGVDVSIVYVGASVQADGLRNEMFNNTNDVRILAWCYSYQTYYNWPKVTSSWNWNPRKYKP